MEQCHAESKKGPLADYGLTEDQVKKRFKDL
jgi:hypothetical protein